MPKGKCNFYWESSKVLPLSQQWEKGSNACSAGIQLERASSFYGILQACQSSTYEAKILLGLSPSFSVKKYDKELDDKMIIMVNYFFHPQVPKFNYVEDLSIRIKDQLVIFNDTGVFRYYSYLVYLLLFLQPE